MNKLDLNCGSIDMIVTPKNEYVFLEVNPVGQFGMVSYPCNYNLEKKIAEYL
jgi:D-alanine-D-alanine ligase-like ATP-grasp enzyme